MAAEDAAEARLRVMRLEEAIDKHRADLERCREKVRKGRPLYDEVQDAHDELYEAIRRELGEDG